MPDDCAVALQRVRNDCPCAQGERKHAEPDHDRAQIEQHRSVALRASPSPASTSASQAQPRAGTRPDRTSLPSRLRLLRSQRMRLVGPRLRFERLRARTRSPHQTAPVNVRNAIQSPRPTQTTETPTAITLPSHELTRSPRILRSLAITSKNPSTIGKHERVERFDVDRDLDQRQVRDQHDAGRRRRPSPHRGRRSASPARS